MKIHSASYGRTSTSVYIHAHLPETNCDSTEDITGKLTTFSFVFPDQALIFHASCPYRLLHYVHDANNLQELSKPLIWALLHQTRL